MAEPRGDAWKQRIRRHFPASVYALNGIFHWAERLPEHVKLTPQLLDLAVGDGLTEQQKTNLEAALWGFLSHAVTGEAETIFNRAPELAGLQAWRLLVSFIEHGRGIRLANLRTEMKTTH